MSTAKERERVFGWIAVIFLALWLFSGAKFFMVVGYLSMVMWLGSSVRKGIEGYVSQADRDLDARLQADTRAAYQRDLEQGKFK